MTEKDYILLRRGNLNCGHHINPELEVVHIEKGCLTIWYESEPVEVYGGEAAVILPYSIHRFSHSKETTGTVYMFSQSVSEEFFDKYNTSGNVENKYRISETTVAFVKNKISKTKLNEAEIRAVFFALISDSPRITDKTVISEKIMRQLVEYLYSHLGEKITRADAAKKLLIPEKAISSMLKNKLDMGFPDFLNSIRVEKAKNLITFNEKNVTEIAFECGFGSVRSFNRAFMKTVGKTPSEYRKGVKI